MLCDEMYNVFFNMAIVDLHFSGIEMLTKMKYSNYRSISKTSNIYTLNNILKGSVCLSLLMLFFTTS